MIETVSRFGKLKDYAKSSDLAYPEAVIGYYKSLGGKLGFTVREKPSVIKYGVNLGTADLVWVEPNVAFYIEFSNIGEMLKHLFKIVELKSEYSVILLSSASSCKPDDVKRLIENSPVFAQTREKIIILDLAAELVVYPTITS